jgi:hypothetical protein
MSFQHPNFASPQSVQYGGLSFDNPLSKQSVGTPCVITARHKKLSLNDIGNSDDAVLGKILNDSF